MFESRRWYIPAVVFGAAFAVGLTGMIQLPELSIRWPKTSNGGSIGERQGGEQLVLVYIGSSSCAWSNREEIPKALSSIQSKIRGYTRDADIGFISTGVAIDWRVDDGFEHLKSVGQFDQVITGRNWSNLGALRYIWQTISGRASTPQLLLVRRDLQVPTSDGAIGSFSVSNVTLVTRKVGLAEIRNWAESGLPSLERLGDM